MAPSQLTDWSGVPRCCRQAWSTHIRKFEEASRVTLQLIYGSEQAVLTFHALLSNILGEATRLRQASRGQPHILSDQTHLQSGVGMKDSCLKHLLPVCSGVHFFHIAVS